MTLHVRQWEGALPNCVLIHGFGEGGYVWDDVACKLSVSWRALAIDLRGHGESERDAQCRYDTLTRAEMMSELLTPSTSNVSQWSGIRWVGTLPFASPRRAQAG